MAKYRNRLPRLAGEPFLTDSGLETTLVFHEGLELPAFAAFDLLKDETGTKILRDYYKLHAGIALKAGKGFVLESPTWRSSPDWGTQLGYSAAALDEANRKGVKLMLEIRDEMETAETPMVVSGCIGPRGDGYKAGEATAEEAESYHSRQAEIFAEMDADLVTAVTMTDINEAIGIARAAKAAGMPVVISFTVETDGHLPSGTSLKDAIAAVDEATGNAPAYYMINCAHPDHFDASLDGDWVSRIRGIRANASRCSHAELDEATELDAGDPKELGELYAGLCRRFPHLTVLGGCCGTDHRHVEEIARATAVFA
jgi:S-methylmethionine-dependent homocysteine/selenocysteine methylase